MRQPQPLGAIGPLRPGRTEAALGARADLWTLVFYALHVPLGILVMRYSIVSTVHALAVLLVGLRAASLGSRPELVVRAAAYLVGCDVLWRMSSAQVFWEFGKYGLVAICLVAVARTGFALRPAAMLVYLTLLLPSIALTVMTTSGLNMARREISFNISGPLALAASAVFFSRLTLSPAAVLRCLRPVIAPIIATSTVVLAGIVSRGESIVFGGESNFATSGGFAPNQVSAALGLGALLAFLCVQRGVQSNAFLITMSVVALVLAAQSALTFSRGGLYAAVGASLPAVYYFARDRRARLRSIGLLLVIVAFAGFFVLPWLDAFTEGALTTRFKDTRSTNRVNILESDLQIFLENPILGVGPGLSYSYREAIRGFGGVAHTEFSRLLAEHGVLGLVAMIVMLVSGVHNIRRQRQPAARGIVAATTVWSVLFMAAYAMRLAAPSFFFGLGFMTVAVRRSALIAPRRQRAPGAPLLAVGGVNAAHRY